MNTVWEAICFVSEALLKYRKKRGTRFTHLQVLESLMAVVVFLRMAKLGSKLLLGPYSMRQGVWFGVGRQVEVRLGLWQIAATVHLSRLL